MTAYRRARFMTHITCRLTANLPRTVISSGTLRSVIEYGLPLPLYTYIAYHVSTVAFYGDQTGNRSRIYTVLICRLTSHPGQLSLLPSGEK